MIEEAIRIAKRSPIKSYKTGAIITYKGRFIANGWSHIPEFVPNRKRSLHAELHALARAHPTRVHGCVLHIATVRGKNDNITLARPCLDCAIALASSGIIAVHYTIDNERADHIYLASENFDQLKVYSERDRS